MAISDRITAITNHLTDDWNSIDRLGLHTNILPKEYTQVDYIESSGTQYIDTGVKAKGLTTNIETKYKLNRLTDYNFIFSVRNDNTTRFDSGWGSNGKIWFAYATGDVIAINGNTTDIITFKKDDKKIYFNNELVITMDNLTDFTTTNNIALFANNNNGTINNYASLKMYYCKLYDNGTLVRDFIPCFRNTDNEVGLYDLVNNVFYTNQGTGSFTYGQVQEQHIDKNIENIKEPLDLFYNEVSDKTDLSVNGVVGRTSQETAILPSEYTQVDYIESSGTQYIDTGVNNNGYKSETEIAWTSLSGISVDNRQLMGNSQVGFWGINANGYYEIYQVSNYQAVLNRWDKVIYEINYDSSNSYRSLIVNENVLFNNQPSTTKPINTLIYLFRLNDNSYPAWCKCKIKYYKIWNKNNELVRDFIPCYRNSDNEVGLYDIVNNVFYTNQGTGTFTYGSVVSIPNSDYPQPINNLTGNVAYKVSGKNLLNNANGTYESWISIDITDLIEDGVNYYASIDFKNLIGSCVIRIDYTYDGTINYIWGNGGSTGNVTEGTMYKQFNIPNHDVNTTIYLRVKDNGTGLTSGYYSNWLLAKSDTATDYEPYIEPQTFNIPLTEITLPNFISGYIDYDGQIVAPSDTFITTNDYIEVKPNTQYTFKANTSGTRCLIGEYNTNKEFIPQRKEIVIGNTYTTVNNAKYIKFSVPTDSTNIEIYETSKPPIELCDIGVYEDKIYSSNGRFYLRKKIGKAVLNGSENWIYTSGLGTTYSTMQQNFDYGSSNNYYANYFLYGSNDNKITLGTSGSTKTMYMKLLNSITGVTSNDTTSTIVEKLKTWLSNHNTDVYYPLATPTTTEITQQNYPSLYNALKQIQDYLTAYKINKEFILGYSSPKIEY